MAVDLTPVAPADAIAALRARGGELPASFSWQDAYAEEHAAMFTVAKSAGFDILQDIYDALRASLESGSTFADFAKTLKPVLQQKGWWGRQMVTDPQTGVEHLSQLGSTRRLAQIFDANMSVSYAAGSWANFERNKAARPFLRYVHLEAQPHPRILHHLWHNTVLPIDDPWWDTHFPPNGWNCHCTVQNLSQRDVDGLLRQGVQLSFERPADTMRNWTNSRTGEIRQVPEGIDPGWDYNPGKVGHQRALQAIAEQSHLIN